MQPAQVDPSAPAGPLSPVIEPPAVQLFVASPARQRRLTVAFRLILVIPHLFVLSFLAVAGLAIVFVGWWGALFTGRLPEFAVTYLSGWARWSVRVNGYLFLLTDAYPPFSFDEEPGYPVLAAIPERGRLNRAAVFFRLILAVWAYIVSSLATTGASSIALFIAWLITLIRGKLPTPLHLAFTAVLRYQTRYCCYLGLLTPAYPGKLFGEEPGASLLYGGPAEHDGGQAMLGPADWRLALSRAAKGLLIVFITLGLISVGCQIWSVDRVTSQFGRFFAIGRWDDANNELTAAMTSWQAATQACNRNVVACLAQADGQAALSVSVFASQIQAISMPAAAAPDAAQVVAHATKVAQDLTELSQATTLTQYNTEYASTSLQDDIAGLYTDVYATSSAL
jgi:hypothetical protein